VIGFDIDDVRDELGIEVRGVLSRWEGYVCIGVWGRARLMVLKTAQFVYMEVCSQNWGSSRERD
jgi:hypothetical protein